MMTRAEFVSGFVGLLLLAGGCGSSPLSMPTQATDSTTSSPSVASTSDASGATQDTSSGAAPTGTTPGDTGNTTGGTLPDPPAGFLNPLDVRGGSECSLWAQDCPADEKCTPISNDGATWNDWVCRPVVPNPDATGEPCTLTQGSGVDGYDTCERHAMCWGLDENLEGTCVGFCEGSYSNPVCLDADSSCYISGDGFIALCTPTCNPLDQNCPTGEACYPIDTGFVCAPDASGETGLEGDPCEFINACDAGLYCGSSLDDCEAAGCCRPFCDVSQPSCPVGTECVPGFPDDVIPPIGQEFVGFCAPPEG